MPPEVYAAQYQISMREGLSTLPPPGSPWLGRRLSSSFQQGRESNYRRSFGSSGRRASFGRHSRVEEQKTREGYRRYSPQDARSGDLHGSQIVMNKLSISEDVNQEPNTTEPTNSDKLKESTRSSKSSGGVTPKRKKKGRLGNESFTQSPTKTIRQETSGCTSDTVTSSQSSRDQGNLSKGPGSGIIADPGATAIVEEPLSIPEENDPDLTNSTTEDENVPSSFGPVDYESKLKGEPTIPWSSGDITIQELRASSTEISHTAESEDSPFALSKTPTRMTETLKHGATAQITGQMVASSTIAPAESEMRDTRAESRVDKAVFAVDTGAGLIDAASNIQVEHASQPTSETQFTSLELGKELFQASRVDFEPADVPMQRKTNSGVVSSKKIVGTGLEVTAPQPKANPLVHKQGPAQTESLSPFGRKKPVKQQAKKESKKKNKLKGKGKGKAQLSAPTAPSDPVSESSRGSRAVSSDSYHTADEPDNDRFEDGKSDDAVLQGDSSDTLQGDVSGTTSGLQTATDVGSPALSVAGRQDSMFATDPEPPDNIEDGAGVMSSAVAMAVQLHDRGRDEITEKVLATVTNVLAASRDESPKTESGGGQDYQNDPSSTTGSRGEPHPLLHHVPHAATSEAQKAEPPSTYTGSPHSHDSSPESSGVVITTVQPSTSMPVVSEKRRPPRLELSDITNLSSASGKAPAKEAARNTSPSVQRSPPPNPGTEETATTPPQKKKRNTQKKKKKQRVSEESETSKTEGSPGSAQYSVPSTSYPPLHHAASTTVVGIWSASATKSLQPSANTEKATVSEGLASLDTAKSVQGYSSQKSPTISEERGKDQQQSIQGEYEESVGKVQKQSLEEQGSRPSVTTSESSTVEIEETFEPLGNISGTRVLTDEVYAADPIRSEDTIYGEQTGRSEEMCVSGMEKKKNNPWATSPMIPKVPFHAIQADDEAKKEEEKAEKLRTKGQKGKESAAEVAVEEKSEMEREITGTAQEAEWTKVEKGKAPAKKLYKGWETQNQDGKI
ncbi:hypothetical protein EV356DRAFT_509602 [Viridothelium virens]|uniref:Uncharacterized protein n=1 Tax=Viridothelium virens TaxID=1048519 RepID=A0A6A6HJQ8_VIRVR|nr:hypothetical protein EV356DRAFT_509602 [Viridothelium virens]